MNKQFLKNKIKERKQQIYPVKSGDMIVGGPQYVERIYLNALNWVEEVIDSQNESIKYVKLLNEGGDNFNNIPLDLIKKVVPIKDKDGKLFLNVEYYDDELCINCSVFCETIEVTEENNPS